VIFFDDDVSSTRSLRSNRSRRRRQQQRRQTADTPAGNLFAPTPATTSLLPPLAGVLDSSAGKAVTPGDASRVKIHEIVRVEVAQALRDQGPVIISQVAPVVKREVLSDVTKLIQHEVATVCQRIATEAANEAIKHWIHSTKRQEELEMERRSVFVKWHSGEKWPGFPRCFTIWIVQNYTTGSWCVKIRA